MGLGHRVWESECDQSSSTDLALHRNRAAMQIGDRFHQRQTQAGALGTARRIGPIKAIKNPGNVLRCNSAAGILHGDFRLVLIGREGNGDSPPSGVKADGIVHQITNGAAEQNWIRVNFTLAAADDLEMTFFRDRFVVSRDPFDRRAAVEMRRWTLLSAASARARKSKLSMMPESRSHSATLDSITV